MTERIFKDTLGQVIEVGDTVVHAKAQSNSVRLAIREVLEIYPTKMRGVKLSKGRSTYDPTGKERGDQYTWTHSHNLVICLKHDKEIVSKTWAIVPIASWVSWRRMGWTTGTAMATPRWTSTSRRRRKSNAESHSRSRGPHAER